VCLVLWGRGEEEELEAVCTEEAVFEFSSARLGVCQSEKAGNFFLIE
jgi:hypothetical protein